MVLGIPDFWIWSVFLLCLGSAALCVIYGLVNWNKEGQEEEASTVNDEESWEKIAADAAENS